MADFFDSPVIRELAAILENIDPFPNPNHSDFERCRGFKKDNIGRCRIRPAQEQNQVDGLLSQFRSMTRCVDTKSLYDKMQTFITLTHCKRYHLDDALEAFDRWKAQRKAATSKSRPVTPLRSVTSHNDSFEFDSDTNSMSFTSLESSSPRYGESTLDLQIADEMKNLKIATTVRDTSSQINDNDVDEIDLQRKIFQRMGDAHIPKKVKGYNHGKIYQELEKPPDAGSRPGILYVLEHTKISGLFKIGRSIFPADVRHKQNCYAIDTEVAYATDEPFFGHSRAEKIAHNILHHKRLLVIECVRCGKRHEEWFLATKDDVLSVVELTERWLKMPAYTLQDGVYKLTPKANDIHKKLLRFSMSKMNSLMDEVYNTKNASRAFPDDTSVGAARETGASAERAIPRILVNESPDITLSQGHRRAKSPAARTSGKRDGPLVETKEIFEMLQRRSRETTPDGDGNYTTVTELEITRTIRTKVSISDLKQGSGIYDGFKPIAFDRNSKKKRGTEVKVQEIQKS